MTTRLRDLAEVNAATPEFDRLPSDSLVTFTPLETIWADERLDLTRVRPKFEVAAGYTRFRSGDVLVPKVTPTFQAGRSAIAQNLVNGVGAGTTELHVLRPRPGVDVRFLRYLVLSKPFLDEGVSAFQGVAGLQRVPDLFMRDYPVYAPPLDEQRRIADFLDAETSRLDRLDTVRKRQVAVLAERGRSAIDELVRNAESTYGLLPLRRLLTGISQGWSPVCEDREASFNEWAVLKTSSITSGAFLAREHKTLPAGITPPREAQVRDGDLLMVRGSGSAALVGMCAVAKVDGRRVSMSDLLYRLRPGSDWQANLIAALLRSGPVRERMSLLMRGQSGQTVKLRAEDIRAIEVPAVPPNKRIALLHELEMIELRTRELTLSLRETLKLIAEKRQALITAAVTGQVDVTTAHEIARRGQS